MARTGLALTAVAAAAVLGATLAGQTPAPELVFDAVDLVKVSSTG